MENTRTRAGQRRIAGAGLLLALLTMAATVLADTVPGNRPSCVTIHPHAWNAGPGWNHLVTVHNGCGFAVHCSITTDANPAPTELDAAAGTDETVNTFLYSPIQGFHPTANCAQR